MSRYLAQTVQKQYSNSATLLALLACADQWIDPYKFGQTFLADVWDISTAVGFGLDIWGRILGVSRNLQVAAPLAGQFFGFFSTGGTPWLPWGQGPFYSGSSGTVAYALPDTYYRQLLFVKAAANIAASDCQSINALMRAMFGDRGPCYVGFDPANPMNIAYHYGFYPTPVELSITQSGLFPQPAGTTATYVYATLSYTPFGFAGSNTGANPHVVNGWSVSGSPFYSPTGVTPLP